MARAWVMVLAASVSIVGLAGCLGGDAQSFEPVPAPIWAAGHSWTYHVSQSMTGFGPGMADLEGESETVDMTLTVFNTTEPLQGVPVFYVKADQDLDHPIWDGSMFAYRKSDLRVVGIGHDWMTIRPQPVPAVIAVDEEFNVVHKSSRPPARDPCEGRASIEPLPADAGFPGLSFPLDDGQTVRGRWHPDSDDDFGFDYVVRVHEMDTVTVPAGTFRAVPITVDLTLGAQAAEPMEGWGSLRGRAEYWYAPDVEYFARVAFSVSAAGPRGGDAFQFRTTSELTAFRLDVLPESPAPIVRQSPGYAYQPVHVVTDTEFPLNVADAPVRATFGLAAGYGNHWLEDSLDRVEAVPAMAPINHETHRIVWYVNDVRGREVASAVADTIEVEFAKGGRFVVRADVEPIVCGAPWTGGATAVVSTFWEKSWMVPVEAGLEQRVPVDSFPVEDGAVHALLSWSFQPTLAGQTVDEGRPVVTDAFGSVSTTYSAGTNKANFGPGLAGTWKLDWQPDGRDLGYGVGLPAVVGDDVTLGLRIDYSWEVQH